MPSFTYTYPTSPNQYKLTLNITQGTGNVSTNSTPVSWSLQLTTPSNNYFQAISTYSAVINGVTVVSKNEQVNTYAVSTTYTLASGTTTVAHNANGTKTIAVSASFRTNDQSSYWRVPSLNVSGNVTLTTIPRYTSITSFKSSSIQRDRFTISWTAANTVNYWWYSLNDGSSWTAVGNPASTTASRTITGLNPGTSYNVKVKVRRSDSNLETTSSRLVVTTEVIASPNTPTISEITRNSFKINVTANKSFNGFQYSINNGSTWSAKQSGTSVTVTGRAAGTTHSVRVKVYDGVHTSRLSGQSAAVNAVTLAAASPNTPTFSSKTAIQVVFNWSSNRTVTNVRYKRWASDTWQSAGADFSARTSGTVTINGLSPNTTYSISVQVKDAVHNSWSGGSGALSVTTYALSTVKGANFNLGSTVTATVTEAHTSMYHDIALEANYGGSWNQVASVANQNKDASLTIPAATITAIENGTPNSTTVSMRLKVTTKWGSGGTVQGSTTGPTFTATIVNANPTLSGATYKDVHSNADFVTWKGGDQIILRNVSQLQITLGTANAIKGAKLSKYVLTVAGKSFTVNATSGATVQTGATINAGVVNSGKNEPATIEVFDTRGNKVARTLTIQIMDWVEPQIIHGTGERLNSYEQPTDLNLLARYSRVLVGGTDKNSFTAQYRIKVKGSSDSTYGAFVDIIAPKGSVNGIWQEVSSSQFMQNLDENTTYTMHIQYKDYVVGWRNYYVDIEMGVGLMEFFEDKVELGVPLYDKNSTKKYLLEGEGLTSVSWSEVTGKPSTFAPATHSHAWSTITSKPADNQFPNTAQALGASQNLNNYTTPGFYYQSANANASTANNYPVARAGTLIVTKDAGTTQMYYEYNGTGVFYRTFYSSTWTAWQNLLTPTWANVSSKPAQATRWPTWSEVTSKPSTFAPSSHTHAWSEVTSKPTTATRWPTWAEVTGKPVSFTRLYNGTASAVNTNYNMTSYSGYEFIIVGAFMDASTNENYTSVTIPTATISLNQARRYSLSVVFSEGGNLGLIFFQFNSATQFRINNIGGAYKGKITYIYGVNLV